MHNRIALLFAAGILAGCVSPGGDSAGSTADKADRSDKVGMARDGTSNVSNASTLESYKRDLAQRISQVNSTRVYTGRPQALLRSVVVLRYVVDAHGGLVRSDIQRSNRDGETEATALASLKSAAPFPKPASHLLRRGQIEISETWLFNNDGRFQLRTIALPQMDQ